ncbi:putative Dol-P-Glc:Glc(2)Man(9)GlcNAc(2)-PP-Dol alpha-1,2-glucosyltransferase [Galendromus occidentalis]|uniref:Dol-P-Glc:Glc(2)Man(9)GlcNAc(2)-PP-Dol alpha-1,2-glucosyltransferase n=1 Tax=Galendromus occidentalis TaxID=34638 RepID=A0AAJ6QW85_9ACAR|nr:putative Dol-P-Glc:Glc(2)Man(9)GlcNAc(2)-PP-Dol alpha-1,2-glucosyltransferase [Galendromus occidentalis]
MAGSMSRQWELLIYCAFVSVVCWIANIVNSKVPIPYMDEIFHVGQAQRYCDGDYSTWDPKITTPPGLYFSSKPMSLLTACSLDVLRATNIIFTLANVYTMHQIRQHLQHDSVITSLVIVLLPVNFFFTFLYYTDPGCIFCLLLMYLFFLKGQHYLAALSGFAGIFFRQTSVVWVFFVACLTLSKHVERVIKLPIPTSDKFKTLLIDALRDCFGYGVVGVLFLVFLKLNDGITLGDRDAHKAVIHLAQIGNFLLFALLFGAPYILSLSNFIRFLDFATKYPIHILVTSLVMYGLFENFIYVHPYMLADNRHYTFYIWRRFLSRESIRQVMVVVYIYVAFCLYNCVRHMGRVWITFFVLCTMITIVPQQLFEFRYFVWPLLVLRLHFRQKKHQLVAEALAYIALNCITFYIFLFSPFVWRHDPGHIQRFMW